MTFGKQLFARWRAKTIAGFAIGILSLVFWASPFFQWFAHFSYDLPFALRSDIHPDEALVVYMDDESRMRLHQPVMEPWDRALHIRIMNELFARHAKAVIFDLLLDESWPDKSVDSQFAESIKAHGKVVLGASRSVVNGYPEFKLVHAVEPLASAAPWGVAELPLDNDGTIRRHFFDEQYTNLAWQAAVVAGANLSDRDRPRFINFYGPAGTIPHASYYQILGPGAVADDLISNRVVFVGMAPIINYQGSKSTDEFKIPYTRWDGRNSPGVEIQATACLNLIRNDWISRLPAAAEAGMIFAGALILSFLLPALKPGTSFGAGALCSFAVAFAAVVSEQSFHYWFNWAVISVVEVPLSLVWITTTILRKRTSEVPMRRIDGENGEEAVGELDSRGRPLKPRIPEHEMLHPFGEGSYGQVWLAKSVFDRYRAVKIVCRNHFKDPKPFDQELHGIQVFEPISRSHEGLVDILQIGYRKTAGYFYYIMELAEDLDLGGRIDPVKYTPRTLAKEVNKRGRISCAETVHIGIILAGALDYLHCQGLVHRDIKPSNIIFVNGIVKLADIGTVTRSNEAFSLVGTEGFYPPEGPGQPQGDIYSLGKVLYEISMGLNSQRCFPALPNELRNDPDREHLVKLNEIILRACHKDPIRRYASAAKLQGDLKRLAKRIGTDAN